MKLPQINIRNKRATFDYELLDTFNAGGYLTTRGRTIEEDKTFIDRLNSFGCKSR